jgi:5-methylcytosine-specific restriction endonuclease McrA
MNPFTYPATAHQRKHGPHGYAEAESFRPWLRDEFRFRCVYCLQREQWGKLRGSYSLDHFLPQAFYPEQALASDNLLYSCSACNAGKGAQRIPNPEKGLTGEDVGGQ